jgi:hypothetical protein
MVGYISGHTAHGNPLDGAKRAYKHELVKNPDLPRLVPGGGKVVAAGAKLYAILPTVDGGSAAIALVSTTCWSYRRTAMPRLNGDGAGHNGHNGNGHNGAGNGNGHGNGAEATIVVGPAERVQAAMGVILDTLARVERRANSIIK